MHKSVRTFWMEYANQTVSGAFFGALSVWFSRGNEWLALFWVMLFSVLWLVITLFFRPETPLTFEEIKAKVDEKMDALRFRGLLPLDGPIDDEVVKRLKAAGEVDFAVTPYQQIHRCTPKEAKRAFDAL